MMRYLFLISLFASTACFAGKSAVQVDITKSLDFSSLCKQRSILQQYPKALEKDGLSRKLLNSEDAMDMPRNPNYADTPEDLDRALVEQFAANKKEAMRYSLGMGCVHYGCDLLSVGGTLIATGFNHFASAFSITKGAGTMKEAVETGVREGSKLYNLQGDVRFSYECEYIKKRRFLPKELRKSIESKLSASYQCDDSNLIPTLESISKILNIPMKSQPPKSGFKQEIARLAEGYELEDKSTTLEQVLLDICINHHTSYTQKAGPNSKSRNMICFQGEPGIGKSYISAAIGTILDLPVIRVILQDPRSFMGDALNPGTLLLALCRSGLPRNAILLIDEVDQALSEGCGTKTSDTKVKVKTSANSATANWLDFFDPDKKTLFLPYLGTEIDMSHYLILMTCNGDIPQPALKDRIPIRKITGLTQPRMLEIVANNILPKLLKSDNPELNIPQDELSHSGIDLGKIILNSKSKSLRPVERELSRQINEKLRLPKLESSKAEQDSFEVEAQTTFELRVHVDSVSAFEQRNQEDKKTQ